VEAFARQLLAQPAGITYNCAARAEHIDEDLLRLMKASGCWMISLGIETGDPELSGATSHGPTSISSPIAFG